MGKLETNSGKDDCRCVRVFAIDTLILRPWNLLFKELLPIVYSSSLQEEAK